MGSKRASVAAAFVAMACTFLLSALPASASTKTAAAPKRGGTLNIAGSVPASTLNPFTPKSTTLGLIGEMVYSSLLTLKSDGTVGPGLASSYRISPNKKILILHLRPRLTFQDGTPLNAKAVVFNLNLARNPATGCICLQSVSDITSVTAPNPTEVVIYLALPDAGLPAVLAGFYSANVISPTAYQSEGPAQFGLKPVGAGPFKVTSYTPGVMLSAVRFAGYWNKPKPYLAAVNISNQSVTSSAYSALEAGQAQMDTVTDASTLGQARSNPSVKILQTSKSGASNLFINGTRAPFNTLAARQAVAYAINWAPINKADFGGLYPPTQTFFIPGTPGYYGPKTPGYYLYNPTKAQQLVNQIGGISFTLDCNCASNVSLAEGEGLQQQMSAVGMHVTLLILSNGAQLLQAVEGAHYQAVVPAGVNSYPDPTVSMFTYLSSKGIYGAFFPHNSAVEGWIVRAQETYVPSQRAFWYKKMAEYYVKNAYVVPLAYTQTNAILKKNVFGVPADVSNTPLENAYLG